ncbi:MAG: FtsX-like permease family protein [Cytophagales bacterium]|nr:MAG: FtsX-like permease family protein [Cytophagales bacterium]
MIKNYFKIAIRNLSKNRIFTAINIIGLAIGIATFVFILEYVSLEKSVNQFHTNLPKMYRLLSESKEGNTHEYMYSAVAPAAKDNFAEVESYCRIVSGSVNGIVNTVADKGETVKSFQEVNLYAVEGNFFEFFSFPIKQGNLKSLQKPFTIAISEKYAKKYFGDKNALNEILIVNNQFGSQPYKVVVVYEDIPENSDIQTDMMLSLETFKNPANLNGNEGWASLDGWESQFLNAFVILKDNANYVDTEQKINQLYKSKQPKSEVVLRLQPATEIHLGSSLDYSYPTIGKLWFVYLLGGIAVLILTIAWFNYINLSTVSSLKRAKEVGIRKVSGASKTALVAQFLGESFLLNLLGFILAVFLVSLAQPFFNELIGKNLSLDILQENWFWIIGVIFLVVGALLSGSYTAFAISSFPAVSVLKGTFSSSAKGVWLRKSLVVFQFGISILLIMSALGLYKQLQFMQSKDLGMLPEQVLVIDGAEIGKDSTFKYRNQSFRQALVNQSFVKSVSATGAVPGMFYNLMGQGIEKVQNPLPESNKKSYGIFWADENYFQTFGIQLLAGSNFTPKMCEMGWKARFAIINETAMRTMGFTTPESAINQKIKVEVLYEKEEVEVIGVIKDYHHESLQTSIKPLLVLPQYANSYFAVRFTSKDIQQKMSDLEILYNNYFPNNPFNFFFADENFNRMYEQEMQQGAIFTTASFLAIFIACLGLFGLAAFTAEQRTKEIGIRKILGASLGQIVGLLSTDFLKLVGVAFVIASPLAYYGMTKWLENFAYKTDISWWIFALAGVSAILIALITVSWQSIKAALMNPVKSLRSE